MAGGRPARYGDDGVRAPDATAVAARNAVAVVFVLNGFSFASLFSRVPALRDGLGLDNTGIAALLLAGAVGSVGALPSAGPLIRRTSVAVVTRGGVVLVAIGLVLAAVGATVVEEVVVAAAGFLVYGVGVAVWDVAMNVEGAAVERVLGRAILPRFHAAWSLGSVTGAGLAVLATAAALPMTLHLALAAVVVLAALRAPARYLPAQPDAHSGSSLDAWRDPRTIGIGLMVMAFALTEGAANDWLALAIIDGYDARHWVGVAGFAVFVVAMSTGRLVGTVVLDRFGRVPVLRATALLALAGLLLLVLGQHPVVAVVGIVLWGLGASLGFPVGMSAGADDPAHAAARVGVVSTVGYSAFLAGPPVLGFIGDRVGTLQALLVIAVLLVPTVFLVSVAREPVAAR
ncbi:MFS transporter [Nocardioides sp. GXQ0305]|uniref:MFS transporter n=1 Tax=Nocardioides sp. GXQ0305 TaxID=3423912 RepID=UPI003D7E18D0